MIYIYEKIELCSYDKIVKLVTEQISCFANEQEMHKHCSEVALGLESKWMAFNGKNASRHFVYTTREMGDDEVRFVFGKPSESHIGKSFK